MNETKARFEEWQAPDYRVSQQTARLIALKREIDNVGTRLHAALSAMYGDDEAEKRAAEFDEHLSAAAELLGAYVLASIDEQFASDGDGGII